MPLRIFLKPGMRLRIQGNARPDRFAFDEMTLMPHGIMKLNVEQRMDNAAENALSRIVIPR